MDDGFGFLPVVERRRLLPLSLSSRVFSALRRLLVGRVKKTRAQVAWAGPMSSSVYFWLAQNTARATITFGSVGFLVSAQLNSVAGNPPS
jgi:hypothetical protein